MQKKEKVLLFFILISLSHHFGQATSTSEVLGDVFTRFWEGLIQANYREYPLSEIIGFEKAILPKPEFPKSQEYPNLLFNQSRLYHLRRQVHSVPYSDWLDTIVSATMSLSFDPTSPLLLEKERAKAAKMNAFCFAMTNQNYFRTQTLSAINNISEVDKPTTPEGGKVNVGWGDWMQAADALVMYAVAYDIIKHELTNDENEEIKRKLSAMVNQMVKHFTKLPRNFSSLELSMGLGMPKNNHILDIAVGVATISLVLDVPEAETWFIAAYNELQKGLSMIHPDGSYQEGYYYGMYVAQRLFTFFLYYEQKTGINLFEVPRIKYFTRWLIDLLREDGTYPLFDDAFEQTIIVFPLGIRLSPLGNELLYIFDRDKHSYPSSSSVWVEIFCTYEQHKRFQNPYKVGLLSFYDGGYSVFRGENNMYGLFLSKPGRPFISGHSHINPLSFTIAAFHEEMLIDAGYGPKGVNDINRNWYISAHAHNIPLINGLGPNQNPVWGDDLSGTLNASYQGDNFSFAVASASYQEANMTRHILFSDNRYFIVVDKLESIADKRISIPWHGKGKMNENGYGKYTWQQNQANIELEYLTLNNSTQFINKQGLNTYFENKHHYTLASFFMQKEKEIIVSNFLPNHLDQPKLESSHCAVISDGRTKGRTFYNDQTGNRDFLVLAEKKWQTEQVESDAQVAFYRSNIGIEFITLIDATYLKIDDKIIFQTDFPISIHLDIFSKQIKGYLIKSDFNPFEIAIYTESKPNSVIVSSESADYSYENGYVHFYIQEHNSFAFGAALFEDFSQIREPYPTLRYINQYQSELDLRYLSYERKTQLQNEIVTFSGKTMFAMIDSTMKSPKFSHNMYGLASGIFSNLWHASDRFKISLPQQFAWEQKIGSWQIRYWERGLLTEKGIKPYEQKWYVNEFLYFSHERYYHEHSFTQLNIKNFKKQFQADFEKYRRKKAYELTFSGDENNFSYQINHRDDYFNRYLKESFSFQSQHIRLQSAYFYYKEEKTNEMNLGFDYHKAKRAIQSGISMSDSKGLTTGNFSVQNRFTNYLFSSGQFEYENVQKEIIKTRLHFFSSWKMISQTMQHNFANNHKWYFTYSLKTRWRTWHFGYHVQNKSNWNNELTTLHQTRNHQFENTIDTKNKFSISGEYFFGIKWNIHSSLQTNYKEGSIKSYGFGCSFIGTYNLTGKLQIYPQEYKTRYLFDGFFSLMISQKQILQIHSEISASKRCEISSYKMTVKQRTPNYAPGILYSKDERGFTRYEGYLELFFY
jgi:hypothetical protein